MVRRNCFTALSSTWLVLVFLFLRVFTIKVESVYGCDDGDISPVFDDRLVTVSDTRDDGQRMDNDQKSEQEIEDPSELIRPCRLVYPVGCSQLTSETLRGFEDFYETTWRVVRFGGEGE